MQTSGKPHPFSDLPLISLHMRDWKDEKLSVEDVAEMMKGFDLSNKTYVPQNIYNAICKYALSLMPHSTTLHYQKTIEWIQSDSYEPELSKLKNIQMFYIIPFCDEPTGVESDNAQFRAFWEQFMKATGGIDRYNDCDFSNTQRTSHKLDLDLTIEAGAEILRLKKDSETGQWVADNEVK